MQNISFLVSPIRNHAFFKEAQLKRLFSDNFFELPCLMAQVFDLAARGSPCRIPRQTPLASFKELRRPTVIQALGNALTSAQFSNALLASQAIQHNPDLLFSRILFPGRPTDVFHNLFGRCPPYLGFLSHLRFS